MDENRCRSHCPAHSAPSAARTPACRDVCVRRTGSDAPTHLHCRQARRRRPALAAIAALAFTGGVAPARGGPTPRVATPQCSNLGLVMSLDTRATEPRGSSYYSLELTNLSGRSCSLTGYPGVSAVGLSGRRPLGWRGGSRCQLRAAHRSRGERSGAQWGVLQTYEADIPPAPPAMRPRHGLRVYPPNQSVSKVVASGVFAPTVPDRAGGQARHNHSGQDQLGPTAILAGNRPRLAGRRDGATVPAWKPCKPDVAVVGAGAAGLYVALVRGAARVRAWR